MINTHLSINWFTTSPVSDPARRLQVPSTKMILLLVLVWRQEIQKTKVQQSVRVQEVLEETVRWLQEVQY